MKARILVAATQIMLSSTAMPAESPDTLQLHAFAALNPIATTTNNFFGNTDDNVSFEFWELGLNASWRPTPEILLSAQVTSRRAGAEDDGQPRLDYGLLTYTIVNNKRMRAGIRLGRVLNPLGLYNETRDVAFTRNSILLPQSIYFERTRDLALSGDGLQLFAHRSTEIGDFYLQFNGGLPRTDDDGRSRRALLGPFALGEFEPEPSFFGRLLYDLDGGRFRFAVSGGSLKLDYDPGGPTDPIADGRFDFRPLFFSAQYND